jgi:hypothetical protein
MPCIGAGPAVHHRSAATSEMCATSACVFFVLKFLVGNQKNILEFLVGVFTAPMGSSKGKFI